MRRRTVRPFGASIPAARAFSMLIGLAVLWVLFDSMRQPANWNWLAANDAEVAPQATGVAPQSRNANAGPPAPGEVVVPGPNDLDAAVMAEFLSREELITDRAELRSREMIAYWQLLGWSRSQSFQQLEQRARRDPALVQIWEEPKKHRGRPFRLKLHIRRVLEWDVDPRENPLGVPKVYEAMGWTDESKSLPYTILFTEKPPLMPIGDEVEVDVVFVGYFFKILTYTAFDSRRGTPLLMGRVRMAPTQPLMPAVGPGPLQIGVMFVGGLLALGVVIWFIPRKKQLRRSLIMNQSTVDPPWALLGGEATPSPLDAGPPLLNLWGEAASSGSAESPSDGPGE